MRVTRGRELLNVQALQERIGWDDITEEVIYEGKKKTRREFQISPDNPRLPWITLVTDYECEELFMVIYMYVTHWHCNDSGVGLEHILSNVDHVRDIVSGEIRYLVMKAGGREAGLDVVRGDDWHPKCLNIGEFLQPAAGHALVDSSGKRWAPPECTLVTFNRDPQPVEMDCRRYRHLHRGSWVLSEYYQEEAEKLRRLGIR